MMELASGDLELVTVELAFNRTATSADLSRNGLSGQQLALLLEAFRPRNDLGAHNTTLAALTLSQNNVGGERGARPLERLREGLRRTRGFGTLGSYRGGRLVSLRSFD